MNRLGHRQDENGKKSLTYKSWDCMKQRCLNPKMPNYARYGGRGISVCEEWLTFENFLRDMGERPKGTSLERINNSGNYEKGNCKWATRSEQCRNRRSNIFLTYNGKTQCLKDWATETGACRKSLRYRVRKGLSAAEILGPYFPAQTAG